MTNLTNEELYNLFLQGNGCAFQELYGRLNHKMYGVAKIHLGRDEDAQDCVSEVFKKLLVKRAIGQETYKPGTAKFSTWLHKVTKNAAMDELRKRKSRRENYTTSWDKTIIDEIDKTGGKAILHGTFSNPRHKNPREIHIKKQIIELLKKAKANLEKPYRSIILARVDDEMEPLDIALKFNLKSVQEAYDLYHYGEKLIKEAVWKSKEYGRLKQAYKDLINAKTAKGILSSQVKKLHRHNPFSE